MKIEPILKTLKSLRNLKVLVIGETIIDEYIFCKAMGRPEKAATVSTKFLSKEQYVGGCLAVANHVSGFVKQVDVITVAGKNPEWKLFINSKINQNVKTLFFDNNKSPTIIKTRFLEDWNKAKLFEVSIIDDKPLPPEVEKTIVTFLQYELQDYDLVIITDFGHGLFTQNIRDTISKYAKYICVNAQTNSANHGFNLITKYTGVQFISLDEQEIRLPYCSKYGDLLELIHTLSVDTTCNKINVTLGSNGIIYYQDKKTYQVPVFNSKPVDTVGAGDAVLSISSLLAYKNTNPEIIPFVGNAVGYLATQYLGNKESINYKLLSKTLKEVCND